MKQDFQQGASEPVPASYPAGTSVPSYHSGEPEKTRYLLPLILFLLTVLTTTGAGFFLFINFLSSSGEQQAYLERLFRDPSIIFIGWPFSVTILAILLAHEMGHYVTCRVYGIRATLPYVIPAPPPIVPFGTFGAVIKIKSLFRDRNQIFDVGLAGPIAGFILIIPALIIGLSFSREEPMPKDIGFMLEFGEPLLFQLGAYLWFGSGDEILLHLHPVGWAAWFGMLATSLNLLPVGQLDGGHVVYALFGARIHRIVSYLTFVALIALSFYSWPVLGYLVFALVLVFIGFRHPRPYIDAPIRGRGRILAAVVGLIIFILTFIPVPVRIVEDFAQF
ncbi:MAG TPA: site-2 protease family protein [Acidobacteriota bacterium]|nr:site-2 protease family protein [Acidobacteriota bacterium]